MELNVELIYDSNCPNVTDARTHLLRAFTRLELRPIWQEWERGNLNSQPMCVLLDLRPFWSTEKT